MEELVTRDKFGILAGIWVSRTGGLYSRTCMRCTDKFKLTLAIENLDLMAGSSSKIIALRRHSCI